MARIFFFCVTITCALGCSTGAPSTATGQEPVDELPIDSPPGVTVDECGRYRVDFAPSKPCFADADCSWTAHRPGSCVDPLCESHYRAGTGEWVREADALYKRVCEGKKWKHCERVKCIHNKPSGASCVEGVCTLRF